MFIGCLASRTILEMKIMFIIEVSYYAWIVFIYIFTRLLLVSVFAVGGVSS